MSTAVVYTPTGPGKAWEEVQRTPLVIRERDGVPSILTNAAIAPYSAPFLLGVPNMRRAGYRVDEIE